jgi:hypothetical protein
MGECNGCTLCCLLTDLPILEKPAGVMCKHCTSNECGIYQDRPKACRDFLCAYRTEDMPDAMHPNNCHIMLEKVDGCDTYVGTVDPKYRGAWVSEAVNEFVDEKVKQGISVVIVGDKKYIKSPDGIEQKDVINELAKAYGQWQLQHTRPI